MALLAGAGIQSADASGRYDRLANDRVVKDRSGYYVVTESAFGGGRVAGRVRQTSRGPQVQLPGGAWIYCERSCGETLRTNTVDFWAARENPAAYGQQGLLRNLWPNW
ncbi:MAG: hypothetical protein AB7O43_09690 [Hyphomicrobiaceae bacterium]